jgi:spermidine synthase
LEALAQPSVGVRSTLPPRSDSFPFRTAVALFVASGAAGLIDQVCFSKYLTYIVGATAQAVSAVLAAFMTGLALGAHLGGRFASRVRRPLVVYGMLELVAAAALVLAPLEFELLTRAYAALARSLPDSLAALAIVRWLVALAIVALPTTAMGATLPILTRAFADSDAGEKERRLGALYAANTIGGALGALGAAYFVLPALGLRPTLLASAAVTATVGLVAIAIGRNVASVASVQTSEATASSASDGALRGLPLDVLALASGFLVFAAEVLFTHLLALIIGNSAYAFGLILAVFLGCLFFGAARVAWFRRRFGRAALSLGLGATGLGLALTLPLWDELPLLFGTLGPKVTTFGGREAVRALAAFSILVLPTVLMGLTFPLLLQEVAAAPDASRRVGRLTAINTIGAVLGALVTGYLVLPALGSQNSLRAVACAFVLAALCALTLVPKTARVIPAVLAGLGALVALAAPRWNLARLTSGANVYFEKFTEPEAIPFLKEDMHGGVTTVTKSKGVLTLYTNGKFQGNTGWEMHAQRFFAHYPSLFVSHFDRALVIGLGTGTTLGTLAAYPYKKLDLVEISPSIIEAADGYFKSVNLDALEDPRLTVHVDDGRGFMLVDDKKYDLISMELSSIWFAGASNLYSREFYRLARARLAPNGIFQQWVQLHHVYPRTFATILNTLHAEFEHVALFYGGGQGILIASQSPLAVSQSRVHDLQKLDAVKRVVPDDRDLLGLLNDVLLTDAGLDAYLEEKAAQAGLEREAMVSTDHNLYLEYATPLGNVLPWHTREALVRDLARFRDEKAIADFVVP